MRTCGVAHGACHKIVWFALVLLRQLRRVAHAARRAQRLRLHHHRLLSELAFHPLAHKLVVDIAWILQVAVLERKTTGCIRGYVSTTREKESRTTRELKVER